MLSFPLPCLLQGCRDACGLAQAASGASAGHGSGRRMHRRMGCPRLLGVGCWVQSWWVLPWQGVGITPHHSWGDELSPGWVGVTGSGDSWGGCSAILGGAASPGLILPGSMWDCVCEAEPCASCTAAHARLGILWDQHKKCCGEHGVASPSSSSSSSSSSSAGSRAQQDKPQLCQAEAKGTAEKSRLIMPLLKFSAPCPPACTEAGVHGAVSRGASRDAQGRAAVSRRWRVAR